MLNVLQTFTFFNTSDTFTFSRTVFYASYLGKTLMIVSGATDRLLIEPGPSPHGSSLSGWSTGGMGYIYQSPLDYDGFDYYSFAELDVQTGPIGGMQPNVTVNFEDARKRTISLVVLDDLNYTRQIAYRGFPTPGALDIYVGGASPYSEGSKGLTFILTDDYGVVGGGPYEQVTDMGIPGQTRIVLINHGDMTVGEQLPYYNTGLTGVVDGWFAPLYEIGDVPLVPPDQEGGRIPCPPLRHRQRDDLWETPRARVGSPGSHPTSAGEMDRRGHINTYDGPGPCFGVEESTCG